MYIVRITMVLYFVLIENMKILVDNTDIYCDFYKYLSLEFN